MIDAHNAKASSYTLGLNLFSDLTNAERKSLYNGFKESNVKLPAFVPSGEAPLADVDWR